MRFAGIIGVFLALGVIGAVSSCGGSNDDFFPGKKDAGSDATPETGTGGAGGSGGSAGGGGSGGVTGGTGGSAGIDGAAGASGASGAAGASDAGNDAGDSGDSSTSCTQPSECPSTGNECITATCDGGQCGTANVADGTPKTTQTVGDCLVDQCDGSGGTKHVADDADVQDDNNACTTDTCNGGSPVHTPVATGTPCGNNGMCNASGQCVGCNAPSDCPGQDTECKARSCVSGVCGVTYTANGTATTSQTPGDCLKTQCDGNGNVVSVSDDTDIPADDGKQCTSEVCSAGTPSHPNLALDTACSQNGGSFCDGAGNCVECNTAAQCGSDTECKTFVCGSHTCSSTFAASGTVTSAQTVGDCHQNQCDGSGNVVAAVDDGDLPPDDGNQCTGEACNNGVPSHPALAANTACTQNGGSYCDGAGVCVECTSVAQCGTSTTCKSFACASNVCSSSNASTGTACNENGGIACDGSGNCVNKCLDADGVTLRDITAPQVGDLLITEIMNNPSGTETNKEWFEVLVTSDVDLVGLSVCSPAATCASETAFSTTDCQRVGAGTFLVFANGTAAQSGLLKVDYSFAFTLVNSASSVAVLINGQLLDAASWISSTTDGTSRTLKKSTFDTVGNDTSTNFCNSTVVYNGVDKGTPGADDPSCL